ncbi:MAG: hypothetical protein K0R53_2451 [Burkholderiales bacterium]|jgi:hypothetical protein|nr:hypothetical protein [Burkholderiales bacterium]
MVHGKDAYQRDGFARVVLEIGFGSCPLRSVSAVISISLCDLCLNTESGFLVDAPGV